MQFPVVLCIFEQLNVDNILICFCEYCPEFICERVLKLINSFSTSTKTVAHSILMVIGKGRFI